MNFKPIRGKPCRIMWSHRDPSLRKSGQGNIFVKNLARTIDNKQLYDTFSVFGNILSCKVATNAKGQSVGYGFVHYESEEAAQTAIHRVDGKVIAGEKVSVAAFKSEKERGGVNKTRFTNLYVKRLPADFTEGKLRELFAPHGHITSLMLAAESKTARPKRVPPGGETKSEATPTPEKFGFVCYNTPEQAIAAMDALNNYEISPEKRLYVGRAQKREEREKELREKFEALKMERQKKYAGVNLYIKNLNDDIDDDRLRSEFIKFGSITSARVMRDDATKKSRGFGFVCFTSPEEATKAVTEMNGRMMDGKPLYVALAQRKDARRAQLEARHQARAKMGPIPGPHVYPPSVGPMFYQPRGASGTYMYPTPMGGRGGWMGPMPPMGVGGRPGVAYQLMPIPNGGRGTTGAGPVPHTGGSPGGRPRTGPTGGGGGGMPNSGATGRAPTTGGRGRGQPPPTTTSAASVPTTTPGIRYNENVRNPAARPTTTAPPTETPEPVVGATPPTGSSPGGLTLKALAAAPEKQKKQLIGEQLFPLIKAREPQLAGKITGMLLEMDNHELIHLLESHGALHEKIQEALAVLHAHEQQQATATADAGEEEETE
jgi:polyadenylate-binding protein